MSSRGHRQNILNPEFTHIGVGIKPAEQYGFIFTQLFIQKP
ncbi:MAG: CAP domain-containing protein [Bacillota bacterium]